MTEARLDEILAPGVAPDEVPELAPLLQARPLLAAFSTLFHGSEAEVLMRLLVLREIGRETDAPRWGPEQLRQRFAFLDPVKLETVLRRLRGHGLLEIGDDNRYALSDLGRNAVAAIGMLLGFAAEDDLELGFLTTQLAGQTAMGNVTPESLGHLLGKLNDLAWHFEDAIASGSEFRIADARRRLSANTRWIEKGTDVLRQLLAGGHELLDRAELALSDEARQIEADTALPPAEAAPRRAEPEAEDLRLLQHFSQRLARLAEPGHAPETLAALVSGGGFPAASYRLSLLALLADAGSGADANAPADGPIGDFMRLPLDVHFDAATVAVGSDEIAAMSAGLVGARGSLPAAQPVPVLDATALPPDEA